MAFASKSVKGLSASAAYPTARHGRSPGRTNFHARRWHKYGGSNTGQISRQLMRVMLSIVACFLLLTYFVWPSFKQPAAITTKIIAEDHHIDKSMLIMTLNRSQSTEPSVRVTVTNLHYSTSLSLLTWDTPFDEAAVAQGVFTISDFDTGEEIISPAVRIDRLLLAKSEDFLELLPRHAVTKDVPIKSPGLTFQPGKNYNVQVRGRWKAVWHADAKVMGEERLRLMGGPTGLINWQYQSNLFKLHVW